MRKVLFSGIMILAFIFTLGTSKAQVSLSVNIGVQPEWGPEGYDYVDYYYMPEYEAYYYVPERKFVYLDGSRWIFATTLPRRFGTVNLFSTYKVVVNEPKAYMHFDDDKVKYSKYKGNGGNQVVIRDSKNPKYAEARNHPDHDNAKAAPAHNNAKAQPTHKNTKGKEDKKPKHPDGGQQPH